MKREELIAYDKWLTRRKWGTGEIISPEKAADLYLAEHPLPPAGGAEEIRREYSEESLDFFRSFIKARKELCAISPIETYSLEKLRGFADKWGFSQDKTEEGFLIDNDRTKQCLSDLTALISEHYYPKEFLLWTGENCQYYTDTNEWMYFESPMTQQYFKGTDELFNYWANNEK